MTNDKALMINEIQNSKSKFKIMGILNLTPDSFSDGGRTSLEESLKEIEKMIDDGADIVDIGGESSRPGSDPVSHEEEWNRIGEIIIEAKKQFEIPISVDTYKWQTAEKALDLGVGIINDISGMRDPEMRKICGKYKTKVIIMHMQGEPRNMQKNPQYKDVVKDIYSFFEKQIALCREDGIEDIILDPGIGFGKTLEHNIELMRNLEEFTRLGYPVLLGTSRKSFLGQITGIEDPKDRDIATQATTAMGVYQGVEYFRVHNVGMSREFLDTLAL